MSDASILIAAVLNFPNELRWAEVNDRKTKSRVQVPVITVLVADETGVSQEHGGTTRRRAYQQQEITRVPAQPRVRVTYGCAGGVT